MLIIILYKYISSLWFWFYHLTLLALRYKITVLGGEKIKLKKNDPKGGILFLANHPSHLDATFLTLALGKQNCQVCIWTLDDVYKNPYARLVARNPETVSLMKVPNIYESRKKQHAKMLRRLLERTLEFLHRGRHVLFFPSGSQKHQGYEEIHGKSAVHRILQRYPHVNIMLVRITGMWGSRFSKAVKKQERSTTRGENLVKFAWNLIKIVLLNLIFFIPKRPIVVEFMPVGEDFPHYGTRKEINRYIEKQFNAGFGPEGEPVLQVPDYFWKTTYTPIEYHVKDYKYQLENVPPSIAEDIIHLVSKKAKINPDQVDLGMKLERDLSLDSLEVTEILIELENKYHLPLILPKQVDSVGHLVALAARTKIEYNLIEGKTHKIRQEIAFPVRACHACAAFIAAFFGFIESQR
jgi:acyl carrier protein